MDSSGASCSAPISEAELRKELVRFDYSIAYSGRGCLHEYSRVTLPPRNEGTPAYACFEFVCPGAPFDSDSLERTDSAAADTCSAGSFNPSIMSSYTPVGSSNSIFSEDGDGSGASTVVLQHTSNKQLGGNHDGNTSAASGHLEAPATVLRPIVANTPTELIDQGYPTPPGMPPTLYQFNEQPTAGVPAEQAYPSPPHTPATSEHSQISIDHASYESAVEPNPDEYPQFLGVIVKRLNTLLDSQDQSAPSARKEVSHKILTRTRRYQSEPPSLKRGIISADFQTQKDFTDDRVPYIPRHYSEPKRRAD